MKLRQIEVFHAVYVHGSISGAARALGISQPSATQTLGHAESTLGFPLFSRVKGRLVPTDDAHVLFGEIAGIQDRIEALRHVSRNLRRGEAGRLTVSALPVLGLRVLPDAVARYMLRYPKTFFDLHTVHHDEIARRLVERETDVVIAYNIPGGVPLAGHRLGRSQLGLFYREGDLPNSGTELSLGEIARLPIVSVIQSGPVGDLIASELALHGIDLNAVASARTFYVAAALVRAGIGAAIVDGFTARAAAAPGLVFTPFTPAISLDVVAVYLETRPPTARMAGFLDMLSSELDA